VVHVSKALIAVAGPVKYLAKIPETDCFR
jgi:hypothetical protein